MLPSFLSSKFMTGVVREFPTEAFAGGEILPLEGVASMEAVWDIIKKDARIAPFVAVNSESPLAEKPDYARVIQALACVREKELLNEDELLSLREPGTPELVGMDETRRQVAERYIRRTADRMAARVLGRVEWMRWQALSTGAIAYDDNKVVFSVDFGVPSDHKIALTGTDKWSDTTNADPLGDISDWMETLLADTGRVATRMYVGNSVPKWLAANAKIRDLLKYNDVIESLVNPRSVLDALGRVLGLQILRYSTTYQNTAGTDAFFLPADRVVLMPDPVQADGERLGDVATGPAKANDYASGLYGWVREEEDPWATYAGAGIHAFPRLYHPNWLVQAEVD
ncbi:MAG: major capsid protein [Armatimonadota bacterium]